MYEREMYMKKIFLRHIVLCLTIFLLLISFCACNLQSNVESDDSSQSSINTTDSETVLYYLEATSSDFAYTQLGKGDNGVAKQTLYNRMKEKAPFFHNGGLAKNKNVAFKVEYSDLGLSETDVFEVWMGFRDDNPIYYWISNIYSYTENELFVLVDDEYILFKNRNKYNEKIYELLSKYINMIDDKMSAYEIALLYHDEIIKTVEYSYEADGITPKDEPWAHNILGVLVKGRGVCESYARTFQLLLNVSGINNILVSGIAGDDETEMENHAWNLIMLDDGNWYWCDLTWDDVPESESGIQYNFFCVNDTQNVNGDDYYISPQKSFIDLHQPGVSIEEQPTYFIDLPERAIYPYIP